MRRTRLMSLGAVASIATLVAPALAATIVIVNQDGAGEGFNDPTPVAPAPFNNATTLGAQRLNAFRFAADLWAREVVSEVPIRIEASMDSLPCTFSGAVLGQAAPTTMLRDFDRAPFAGTWYPKALANKLAGVELDPTHDDVSLTMTTLADPACPLVWYYGLDGHPQGEPDFVTAVAHEIGHGLGFTTPVDETTGAKLMGLDDAFERNLEDGGVHWPTMTDAERVASAIDTGNLRWDGPAVVAHSDVLTSGRDDAGRVLMYAPNPVAPGSSVAHFDTTLAPSQLLGPFVDHPIHDLGLARDVLADLGWGTETPDRTCPDIPIAGCRNATSSFLRLSRRSTPMSTRLRWVWKGAASPATDFMDPRMAGSKLRLCFYQRSIKAEPLMDAAVPASGRCGGRPCWKSIGSAKSPTGYRFRGGAASPDGIVAARLQATSRGASIVVAGKGATLPLASLGLTLPIWAQLSVSPDRAEEGTCWQGVFLSALRNDPRRFEARGAVIPR